MGKSRLPLSVYRKKRRLNPALEQYIQKRKLRKEAEAASREAGTYSLGQDHPTTATSNVQDADFAASTSGRYYVNPTTEEVQIKEELIVEDYENPNNTMEHQYHEDSAERITDMREDIGGVLPSSSGGGPFETVICGSGDIKIKQEIFEDEAEDFGSLPVNTEITCSVPTIEESSQPISEEASHCAFSTNLDSAIISSKTTRKKQSSTSRSSKPISNPRKKNSEKMGKAVPTSGLETCKVCVNETFSTPSDLLEHCILEHSGASSGVFPPAEPSNQQPFSVSTIERSSGSATPGFSSATPGHSDTHPATAPSPSVSNMPGQPPDSFIPPYISACDVFDGLFVSLRNIAVENRKTTKDKILELVKLISSGTVDPELIRFSVVEK